MWDIKHTDDYYGQAWCNHDHVAVAERLNLWTAAAEKMMKKNDEHRFVAGGECVGRLEINMRLCASQAWRIIIIRHELSPI